VGVGVGFEQDSVSTDFWGQLLQPAMLHTRLLILHVLSQKEGATHLTGFIVADQKDPQDAVQLKEVAIPVYRALYVPVLPIMTGPLLPIISVQIGGFIVIVGVGVDLIVGVIVPVGLLVGVAVGLVVGVEVGLLVGVAVGLVVGVEVGSGSSPTLQPFGLHIQFASQSHPS